MAVTENTYTGNGSTTNYSFTFPYLETSDIKVTLNGTLTTAYTLANATTVSFNTAPSNGVAIRIYRQTDDTTAKAVFYPGSAIRAQDLNDNFNQVLYSTQETVARRVDSTGGSMTGNLEFSAGKGIVFEGATDDAHETTLLGGDPTADRTLNLPNVSGTLVSTGDTGTVATAMIADSNVTTAKIADSNVTTAKIADANITTAKLADGSVTSAKIADGTIVADDIASSAVTTAKILDSNVTTAKIADSNVTTAKLADGSVTSAKIADGTIVAGDIASDAVVTSKILDQNVTTAKIADQNVTTAKIADLNVTTGKINDQAVTAAKIADGVIDSTKLTGATVVTNAEHTGSTPNDTSFFTTSASDSRYFRQDSSETITSGNPWSSSDTYVATTAAIDARVIDLVDDVGGFVPITNETSFPLTNPDINNPDGSGTIISIKEIVTTRTPASGTVTIANGAGSNTVTINGCGSTVLASGFGVLVETTSTLHTYNFHRLVPKATEVTTVAGISGDITTVATNNANVTAVAGNAANINTVAGNNANVTAVATNSTNINAVAGNATNINAVAGNAANINTVSTSIANVNNVGGSIANVNSVAGNLNTVNDFAARYRVSANDPTANNDAGDLVFNTTNNELRVFNGTAWQGGVTATGNLVSKTGDTFTGPAGIPAGTAAIPGLFVSGDPDTGLTSPGPNQLDVVTGGVARITFGATGDVNVPGALTKGGSNVVTVGDTGTVTSAMIADGTIVNGDISATAAIDKTKISGTAITAADTGTVTSAMIADGTIVNADINAAAAIAASKISGTAITAADIGTVTSTMIADGTIVNGDISASAGIAVSKLAASTISGVTLGGSLSNVTFNNGGAGGASGSTFNGSGALTVSYNTVGAPSTTGANASGTWGINVSGTAASLSGYGNPATSATANTIAYRDANGYLFASFFNQSSANNENPTISQILVTNGSDGYLRKANIAHLTNNVQNNASGTWSINVTGSSGSCSGNAATATQLSTASGSAPSYSARAWVNFNGTSTVSIRASGNVSSITDNGVGDYTVNFTTAMPDANYTVVATTNRTSAVNGTIFNLDSGTAPTTTAVKLLTFRVSTGIVDTENNFVAIFR